MYQWEGKALKSLPFFIDNNTLLVYTIIMLSVLQKLGFVSDDGKISITNLTVYIFLFIVAFRTLFSGATVVLGPINWHIADLDISATLPLLFGLINYAHKRTVYGESPSKETNV